MACSKYSDGKLLEINDYNNPMITKIEMKLKECKNCPYYMYCQTLMRQILKVEAVHVCLLIPPYKSSMFTKQGIG